MFVGVYSNRSQRTTRGSWFSPTLLVGIELRSSGLVALLAEPSWHSALRSYVTVNPHITREGSEVWRGPGTARLTLIQASRLEG